MRLLNRNIILFTTDTQSTDIGPTLFEGIFQT